MAGKVRWQGANEKIGESIAMPVSGIDHYNLRTARELLDALRAFYCDVVGLRQGHRPPFATFGYWLYAGEQAVLHLSEADASEARQAGVVNTFDHVAFACSNLAETEASLAAMKVPYRVAQVPATGVTQIFLTDPAGNGVELNFAPTAA